MTTAISFSIFFINILLKTVITLLCQVHEACILEKFLSLLSHNSIIWTENEYLTGKNDNIEAQKNG